MNKRANLNNYVFSKTQFPPLLELIESPLLDKIRFIEFVVRLLLGNSISSAAESIKSMRSNNK